jgi:hypothetical protein
MSSSDASSIEWMLRVLSQMDAMLQTLHTVFSAAAAGQTLPREQARMLAEECELARALVAAHIEVGQSLKAAVSCERMQ